mmetsp:Transcript_16172/g.11679  ORF Transcript_16172/g.11679 Transcript_16172/m.11679 type:complete len:80 (+) Transcript_16172:1-240(+)
MTSRKLFLFAEEEDEEEEEEVSQNKNKILQKRYRLDYSSSEDQEMIPVSQELAPQPKRIKVDMRDESGKVLANYKSGQD